LRNDRRNDPLQVSVELVVSFQVPAAVCPGFVVNQPAAFGRHHNGTADVLRFKERVS